tara:strand:- start:343 stop:1308 length:966 start_codon:yes stop_codon:yes gene_type:complete
MKITVKDPMEEIKTARPNLKINTVKQYETNLNKLKKIFDTDDFDFLDDPQNVLGKIDSLHYTTQRNFLNAIIVLLMALNTDEKYDKLLKEYGDLRDGFNNKYDEENKSGIISDKQSKNFATIEEVYEMINKMGDELKPIKKKNKDEITKKEMNLLQVFVLFSIYAKYPMRNDVSEMEAISKRDYNKLKEDDKKSKNYLVVHKGGVFFVLNKYKTSKKYEEIKIEIDDPSVKKLLRYYLRMNGMGVLFKSSTGKPLTRIEISKILLKYSKKYMDKSISTTLLRKIYLSSKYGDIKKELEKDNQIMGHSKEVALDTYVKEAQD